jgi:antirestriction protein ArdC
LTYRQAQAVGGNVRRGETGTVVCYADRFTPKGEIARAHDEDRATRQVAFLKRFTVFNVDQCEGLPVALIGAPDVVPEVDILPQVQALIDASGADFRVGGDKAYYAPGPDYVAVPPPGAFHEPVNWYRTALHELGHWTGHHSRLDRDQRGGFGGADYAREELVAEMASAFACASLAITPTVRHADYIGNWLAVLRDDERAIFRAASAASKAADYLLGFAPEAV